jgi:hypothetical protein
MLVHWLITQTYIKVAFETKQLVNPEVYLGNRKHLADVKKFRRCMKIINMVVILVIIVIGVVMSSENDKISLIAFYCMDVLLWSFMLAWAWTLVKLYRGVKNSKKLLPNKNVFLLHGSLLTLYLVLESAAAIDY